MGTKLRLMMAVFAAMCLALAVGCSDDDEQITSQRSDIVRFLTSTHVPRLVAEEDKESSLEAEPPFYEKLNQDLYRYVANYYDSNRSSRTMVDKGDQVSLTYTAYIFRGGMPRVDNVYISNDTAVISQLKQAGLNAEYWSAEPLVVTLGESNIIKGVSQSLVGCRQGDQVEVYMTFEEAYEDKVVGIVPHKSAVAWFYTIDAVVKK
ncbi:MAG: FKBP-type peptidyl-prolyl cis-trans isomerase [Alistipes sp.]|nr:FKBP-type peptidyl-prolyl cis-trans isomerase [Alistipes sp.]